MNIMDLVNYFFNLFKPNKQIPLPQFIVPYIKKPNRCKFIDISSKSNNSEYINFIEEKDFANNNIVYGFDVYNRFFLSVKNKNINNYCVIKTIFQRFSDNPSYLVLIDSESDKSIGWYVHRIDIPFEFTDFFDLLNQS